MFLALSLVFLYYLLIPNNRYPLQIPDAYVSTEPADVETLSRRGYFTDLTREEVISHYKDQFTIEFLGIRLLPLRLNYPPEEAYERIRDQTRSTFLEELVFPFRESIYINGFEPKEDKDAIVVSGRRFRQKITVRHIESPVWVRGIVGLITAVYSYFLFSNQLLTIRRYKHKK